MIYNLYFPRNISQFIFLTTQRIAIDSISISKLFYPKERSIYYNNFGSFSQRPLTKT